MGSLARSAVLELLDQEVVLVREHGCPLVVMMVGIEHLDLVVRRRGLPAKADLLRESEVRLAQSLRRSDSVGWYGEGELLLVLPVAASTMRARRPIACALVLAARRALWRARSSGGSLEVATADDFTGERRTFLQ